MTPDDQEARENLRNYNETAPPTKNGHMPTPAAAAVPAKETKGKPDRVRALFDRVLSECDLVNSAGHHYAVSKSGSLGGTFGPAGTAQMFGSQLRYGILRLGRTHPDIGMISGAIADTVMDHLRSRAAEGPPIELGLRFRHITAGRAGERIYIDLGHADDGRCIEIRPGEWDILKHPPEDVIFRRSSATRALPLPQRGGDLTALAGILDLDPTSAAYKLILGWVLGLPFNASVQPGLLLIGAPGRGKSTRLRLAVSIWEPSPDDSLGSSFGRKADDDIVRALHRSVPLWDNLTNVSGNTSDLFCTMITGTSIEGRKYYSNADFDSHLVRRPIGFTAIGMPAGFRPDALDRLIAVDLPEITNRAADAAVQARFDREHPKLLGAACDAVAAALVGRALTQDPTQYRMAAYAGVLAALDAATAIGGLPGCPTGLLATYDESLREFRQRTAAEDAFGGPLFGMLRHRKPREEVEPGIWETNWKGKASQLRADLMAATALGTGSADTTAPGWPKSDKQVPTYLANLTHALRDLGITWRATRSRGYTLYDITLRGGAELWDS